MHYNVVGCGGTFDHFHDGHKAFLRFAFSYGRQVIIGITSDMYVQKYKKVVTTPFAARKSFVKEFLQKEGFLDRVTLVPLDDIVGPAVDKNTPIEAIIVTKDTQEGADTINQKRKSEGLSLLPVIIAPVLRQNNVTISSTAIRQGKINSHGMQFIDQTWFRKSYILPQQLRNELHKPFGRLLHDSREIQFLPQERIITVGDITTSICNKNHIRPKISVVDFFVERKKIFDSLQELGFASEEEVVFVKNPAGMITANTWQMINSLSGSIFQSKKNFIIVVDGEEDLLVIPFILALPLDFYILYGQPHEGMVEIKTTQAIKERAYDLFTQFHETTTRGY